MNILFLSKDYPPNLIGGAGVYVYEMSKLLIKMGHKTYVITATDDIPIEFMDKGVKVFRVKTKRFKILDVLRPQLKGTIERLEYSLAVSEKVKELLDYIPIDIVETSEARAEGFWYYLFRKKPPLIIKLHTPETVVFKLDNTPSTLDYTLIKLLEEFWISKATNWIGLSEAVVNLTAHHFSIKFNHIPLVSNPIDIELFRPSFKLSNNDNLEILYIGRLEFRKGVHTLIQAFSYVQQYIPKAKLIFIGADCGMKDYLLRKIAQLKYPEKVEFIDQLPREQVVVYYQRSTVCVVPSLWENYPYVCLEAMACGRPLIASNTGGIKDIITHNFNGMLFPPGSSKGLGETIVTLLKNKKLRNFLGLNARRTIEEKHAPEKIAQKTIDIYQDILNKL